MNDLLPWLNLLLLPTLYGVISIKVDIARLQERQGEHERRLAKLERVA